MTFHDAVLAEGGKALVGYDMEKALANVVLMAEIPTSYDKEQKRQVNAGNLLLRGVPGVGKTFFGVILAAISDAKFARIQGRADLQPAEVVGFQMINPATGEFITEFGPLASARDHPARRDQSHSGEVTERVPRRAAGPHGDGGQVNLRLPEFSFALATMNPVELGQGTFPLSEAATDRFADHRQRGLSAAAGGAEAGRASTSRKCGLGRSAVEGPHHRAARGDLARSVSARAHRDLHPATRRRDTTLHALDGWYQRSPSELWSRSYVDLGASPRATICWGRLAKTWALLQRQRASVFPEDVQELARYVLGHRVWLAPQAASQGVTVET